MTTSLRIPGGGEIVPWRTPPPCKLRRVCNNKLCWGSNAMKSASQSNSCGSNSTLQARVNHLLATRSRHSTRIPRAQNYINDVKKTKVKFIFCFSLLLAPRNSKHLQFTRSPAWALGYGLLQAVGRLAKQMCGITQSRRRSCVSSIFGAQALSIQPSIHPGRSLLGPRQGSLGRHQRGCSC